MASGGRFWRLFLFRFSICMYIFFLRTRTLICIRRLPYWAIFLTANRDAKIVWVPPVDRERCSNYYMYFTFVCSIECVFFYVNNCGFSGTSLYYTKSLQFSMSLNVLVSYDMSIATYRKRPKPYINWLEIRFNDRFQLARFSRVRIRLNWCKRGMICWGRKAQLSHPSTVQGWFEMSHGSIISRSYALCRNRKFNYERRLAVLRD